MDVFRTSKSGKHSFQSLLFRLCCCCLLQLQFFARRCCPFLSSLLSGDTLSLFRCFSVYPCMLPSSCLDASARGRKREMEPGSITAAKKRGAEEMHFIPCSLFFRYPALLLHTHDQRSLSNAERAVRHGITARAMHLTQKIYCS